MYTNNTSEFDIAKNADKNTTTPEISKNNNNANTTRRRINHKIIMSVTRYWEGSNPEIGSVLGLTSEFIYKTTSFDILK